MTAIRYWTPDRLNTQAAPLAGYLLANRAFVVALGLAALAPPFSCIALRSPLPVARGAPTGGGSQPGVTGPVR
jgi:hypothetical protein